MQKMAIFQRFSRTFRENSSLAKAMNNFTISGGDLMAYPQAKSGNGMNVFNAIAAESKKAGKVAAHRASYLANCSKNPEVPNAKSGNGLNIFNAIAAESNAGKVAAQQDSYLANCSKNPEVPLCFRGERHQYFHTSRYNNFGLFAPLGGQQTAAQLPVNARRFYRRGKGSKRRADLYGKLEEQHKQIFLETKKELKKNIDESLHGIPHPLRVHQPKTKPDMILNARDQRRMLLGALKAAAIVRIKTLISQGKPSS